jgi:type II secretory pathway pseudopilin PulG
MEHILFSGLCMARPAPLIVEADFVKSRGAAARRQLNAPTLGRRPHLSGGPSAASDEMGFSLLELMMVAGLISILAGIAIPVTADMISRARADSSNIEAVTWLESARNRATAERRNFEVTFDTATNRIRVDRVEPDLTKTLILNRELPGDTEFLRFAGVPDTPDLFGNGSAVDFDGPAPHAFTSDGSLIDANGDPSNGTIFMGKSGRHETGRAITVLGVTGLLRTWQLSGDKWRE